MDGRESIVVRSSRLALTTRERSLNGIQEVSAKAGVRKALIVALARKLLIALWRYVTTGEVPVGAKLRPAT
jgi:hypothetical protein